MGGWVGVVVFVAQAALIGLLVHELLRRRRPARPGRHPGARCSGGVHVVKDERVTCECQGVSVMRDDGSDDVLVTIYGEEA
jgi:hypothetical protein